MMDSQSAPYTDSVSYGGGEPAQQEQGQPQEQPNSGDLSLPDIIYGFMLLLSNVSALLAFSILSSDHEKSKIAGSDNFSIKFDDYSTLQFSVFVSVMMWLWTLGLLALVVTTQFLDVLTETPLMQRTVKRGNVLALFIGYTAAIGCASFSSSCQNNNHAGIDKYHDDDVKDDITVFCHKVSASCTFTWFAFLSLGSAVVLKLYLEGRLVLNAEGNGLQYSYASDSDGSHMQDPNYATGQQGPPKSPYVSEEAGSFQGGGEGGGGVGDVERANSFVGNQNDVVSSADL